ncbi:hypothetical protein C7M84_019552 [Penaeus vannamei]|uniref:G-protein coupled receptors family 1 profile domain-containing protein n=1 Tax=Penaeus vannamei TaxID=6689 RepID=A0A3R7LTN9_PENVA|nr:hypothetical protein C7M84_019552 [Penaeus vannamei]
MWLDLVTFSRDLCLPPTPDPRRKRAGAKQQINKYWSRVVVRGQSNFSVHNAFGVGDRRVLLRRAFHRRLRRAADGGLFIGIIRRRQREAQTLFLLQDEWLAGGSCAALGSAWFTLHVAALWTLTALNVDKYVAIASPLHYARFVSPGRVGAALSVSWALSAALCALPLVAPGLRSTQRAPGCFLPDVAAAAPLVGRSYALVLALLGYFLPALLVAAANGRILVIARHHRHRIVSALWDVTVSAQATVTPQRSHFYLTRYRGRSAANTVFHFVGTLFILYLPSACCLLYEAMARARVPASVSATNFVLLAFAPAVNGFVYGVKSKVLRKNFKNFLRKRLYRSEVNYEIQSRAPSAPASRRPSITPSISLPLQQKLQRRMSEILIQPASASTPTDAGAKLVRRSSELSFRPRGSTSSIPRDVGSCARPGADPHALPASAPRPGRGRAAGGRQHEQASASPTSPLARTPCAPSRPSPRRAAWTPSRSARRRRRRRRRRRSCPTTAVAAPRALRQEQAEEPRLRDDLPVHGGVRRRGRAVSAAQRLPAAPRVVVVRQLLRGRRVADGLGQRHAGRLEPVPLRFRKKAMFRNNGLRFDFSKLSLERIDSEDVRQSVDYGDAREQGDADSPVTPPVAPPPGDGPPTRNPVLANGKFVNKTNGHHEIAVMNKRKILETAENV